MTPSHTRAAAPNGDVRDRRAVRPLPSVMAAQAAIHASIRARAISETAPTSKRVVGARLRGHDVSSVATASIHCVHFLNESHSS